MVEDTQARSIVKLCSMAVFYILISAGLINFNKYMMAEGRFSNAGWLTTVHMGTTWICSLLLYKINPGLFPTMENTMGNRMQVLKFILPISCAFAGSLFFANYAYLFCNVPFLQFMKQTNVASIFFASCLVGSQVFDRMKFLVICFILSGSITAITGEINFVWYGFCVQATASFMEVLNILLKERILTGNELKLDPLTFQIFVCPGCLLVLMIANYFGSDPTVLSRLVAWWPYLLANGFTAFLLNVTIATVIKTASAFEFILMGVIKDFCIVIAATVIHGDSLTLQQCIGFTIATSGIFYWSSMKIFPSHPLIAGPKALLGLKDEKEEQPLAPQAPSKESKV